MRKRILVADDSELIRQQVRRILEPDQQVEICAEADNGMEAVRKVAICRPDLVVIDIFMPQMSGLEAVREIRKTSPHLPVAVLTLHDSGGIRAESEKAGADAFLVKANAGAELLPTIQTLLRRNSEPITA